MAGGLNALFIANPTVFLKTHRIIVKLSNSRGQTKFQTGVGSFDLVDAKTPGACFVEPYVDSFFRHGNRIGAFMLWGRPNQPNDTLLSNAVNYMVTINLSGCQFMAYGPDRNNLTVEHNNYLGENDEYANRYQQIQNQNNAIFCALRPSFNVNVDPDEYFVENGAMVVGWKKDDGWHFYARKNTHKVDGEVIEL